MRHVGSGRTNLDRRGGRSGQALVEFALVIPVFLLLLFGVVDFGRLIYMNSTVSQAAREGARLASVEAMWVGRTDSNCNATGGPVCPATVAALRADVLAASNRMMAPFGAIADADLYTSCDATTPPTPVTTATCAAAGRKPGAVVSVRVVLTYRPITPLISSFFSSIPTSGSATMVIN
jgi:Flp pilus assembly protein TadG